MLLARMFRECTILLDLCELEIFEYEKIRLHKHYRLFPLDCFVCKLYQLGSNKPSNINTSARLRQSLMTIIAEYTHERALNKFNFRTKVVSDDAACIEKWIIFRSSRANHLIITSLSRLSPSHESSLSGASKIKSRLPIANACRNASF